MKKNAHNRIIGSNPINTNRIFGPPHRLQPANEAAAVETLTVSAVGELPLGMVDGGETAQLALAGAPLQLKETTWLNPARLATLSEYWAVCPGATVADAALPVPTLREKSAPELSRPKTPTPFVVPT